MDTKRFLLNITFVLGLVLVWHFVVEQMYQHNPSWRPTTAPTTAPVAVVPATAPSLVVGGGLPVEPAATRPTTTPAVAVANAGPTTPAVGLHAEDTADAPTAVLGSTAYKDQTYALGLTVDPRGAGVDVVTLNQFYKTANDRQLYTFQLPATEATADGTRSLATGFVVIDQTQVDLTTARWRRTAATVDSATYALRILDGTKPVLELTKTFALERREAADGSKGYEVAVRQGFHNLSDRTLTVSASINGPTVPAPENSRSEDRRFVGGFDEGDQVIKTGDTFVTDLSTKKPAKDLATVQPLPLLWLGTCNSYFDAILRPDVAGKGAPVRIASAPAVGLDDATHDSAFSINTTPVVLAAGAAVPFDVHAFFGPKQRQLLKNAYYEAFPRAYNSTLVYTSGFCGFLTFGWLIDALYGILSGFHFVFRDWGLAIIGLVILVRSCLHPITKRSQINMMGMSKMGPEIERLKKKYGDDKDGLNKAMMTVYKEQGLTPILGCLPMLLQTPIWLALWAALQSTFEIRQAPFLHPYGVPLTWINDLSQPDALVTFAHPVSLIWFTVHSINILPVLLAGVFFVQQMMQPVPANQTPEQEQQRKMMRWMSLLYPVLFYVSPSGLNLYILTSTSIGIVESKIVRDHIKERAAAETAGRIIVDAPGNRGKKRGGGGGDNNGNGSARRGVAPKKPGGGGGKLANWLAELQSKAQQAVQESERRKAQKK